MPFNQHRRHRLTFPAGEPLDNQPPTSPMDTDFSVPPTPMDPVFSQSSSSSSASPMDICFPDSLPRECATSNTASPGPITLTAATTTSTPCTSSNPAPQLAQPPKPFSTHRLSAQRDGNRKSELSKKLREMALRLAPLVQLTTGQVHPSFPSTLLSFWLLTDAELESLAHFYHQRTPCRWTFQYPCPVTWDSSLGPEEKRRRIGKFIGLRGCETPVKVKSEEEIMEEVRRAREREEEDEVWRRKLPWC